MHRPADVPLPRRQRGAVWMAVAGLAVAGVMVAAWISSGRIGYLMSGIGFVLLVPSYWQRSVQSSPAGAGDAVAAPPRAPRWVMVSAFTGGVLVLIGLVVTFLA